jgi:cell shape-determining protein MreC
MYHYSWRRPSKRTVFAILMVASAINLLMPYDLFRPVNSTTQLIALAQLGARETTQRVAEKVEELSDPPVTRDEHRQLKKQKQALENEVLSLQQQLGQLREANRSLTAIRNQSDFPQQARLIPARIMAPDSDNWRESLLVGKGTSTKVQQGNWVTSHWWVQAGREQHVQKKYRVLARESLLGWVDQANRWTSRVVLLSDPFANRACRVRIVNTRSGKALSEKADASKTFILQGAGDGLMRIPDIPRQEIENGHIELGSTVVSDPCDGRFPVSMVIGTITELRHNKKKPLYYDAFVRHQYSPGDLHRVYIVDLPGQFATEP